MKAIIQTIDDKPVGRDLLQAVMNAGDLLATQPQEFERVIIENERR